MAKRLFEEYFTPSPSELIASCHRLILVFLDIGCDKCSPCVTQHHQNTGEL